MNDIPKGRPAGFAYTTVWHPLVVSRTAIGPLPQLHLPKMLAGDDGSKIGVTGQLIMRGVTMADVSIRGLRMGAMVPMIALAVCMLPRPHRTRYCSN